MLATVACTVKIAIPEPQISISVLVLAKINRDRKASFTAGVAGDQQFISRYLSFGSRG